MKKAWKAIALTLVSACMLTGFSATALAVPDDLFDCTTSRDTNNDISVSFRDLSLTLPESWTGKCLIQTSETAATFYQSASRERYSEEHGYPNGGRLFSICFSETLDFLDDPAYDVLGDTADGHYYVSYPTDFQGYEKDQAIADEYRSMLNDVTWIVNTVYLENQISNEDQIVIYDDVFQYSGEYIFPQSSTSYLTRKDLKGLDYDTVQMAINEIYARHHRKFVLPEVQEYFDGKSWYEGYVDADQFDVNVMNVYEGSNINLMVTRLEELR